MIQTWSVPHRIWCCDNVGVGCETSTSCSPSCCYCYLFLYYTIILSNSQGLPASLDHEVLRQLPCRLLGSWCQFRTSMRILGSMQVSKCEFPSMTLPLQCSPKVSERVSARTSKGFLAPLPPQPRHVLGRDLLFRNLDRLAPSCRDRHAQAAHGGPPVVPFAAWWQGSQIAPPQPE